MTSSKFYLSSVDFSFSLIADPESTALTRRRRYTSWTGVAAVEAGDLDNNLGHMGIGRSLISSWDMFISFIFPSPNRADVVLLYNPSSNKMYHLLKRYICVHNDCWVQLMKLSVSAPLRYTLPTSTRLHKMAMNTKFCTIAPKANRNFSDVS
jgi:hypothetical protein